jgi:hypothetical protein
MHDSVAVISQESGPFSEAGHFVAIIAKLFVEGFEPERALSAQKRNLPGMVWLTEL